MKRFLFLLIAIFFSMSVLVACSSESEKKGKTESTNGEVKKQEDTSEDVQESSENKQEEGSEDSNKNQDANTSAGDFKDQTDLKIGDTGQAESTIGKYEISINSIRMLDNLEGKSSMFDHFFIVELTVGNIGDGSMDVVDIVDNLELASSLDGGGSGDYSKNYPSIKALTGVIEPGNSVTGEVVFHGLESETYYIRTKKGLIGAGAVKNETTWTFEKSEAQ